MKKIIITAFIFLSAAFCALPEKANRYFSPNLDGVKDTIPIPLKIKDDSSLAKWKVRIYEKVGAKYEIIRVYESTSSIEIKRMTLKKFFSRIFQKKEPIQIPEYVHWDGIKQIEKNKIMVSERMKDGIYYFQIVAIDESGNTAESPLVPIVLDTIYPVIEYKVEHPVFSPNGDGNKDKNTISMTGTDLEDKDTVTTAFTDAKGLAAASFTLKGSDAENRKLSVTWDGTDGKGVKLPEGGYELRIESQDLAGNLRKAKVSPVKLVRTFETVTLEASVIEFAPNNNGFYDNLTFDLATSSAEGLEKWELQISKADGARSLKTFSGKKDLMEIITFSGNDDSDEDLPDGDYQASLVLWYDSGNNPKSPDLKITIDRTPPEITLGMKHDNFIPIEGASGRKTIEINQEVKGRGNEKYKASIRDEQGMEVFASDFQDKPPVKFSWDGKNIDGEIIPGSYTYTLTGEDTVGNKTVKTTKAFELIGEKSDVSIKLDRGAFSPNGDGKGDTITFLPTATGSERVNSQVIEITDAAKKVIRTLQSAKYQAKVSWDGKDEKGETVPDGKYYYNTSFEFSTGEKPVISGKVLYVDTKPIEVELTIKSEIFSPNGDGNLDHLIVDQKKIKSELLDTLDKVWVTIKNREGKIYRKRTKPWTGTIPSRVNWPGTDQMKNDAPEGEYIYEISTEDAAGNTSSFEKTFSLVRKMEEIDLTLSAFVLSTYEKNTNFRSINMIPSFSSTKNLQGYSVFVLGEAGNKIKIGSLKPDEDLDWKGLDTEGNPIPGGNYYLYAEGKYLSGNCPVSETKDIVVDNDPPQIRIITSPEYFSPDKDGVDDTLSIGLKIIDNVEVKKTEMLIYRKIELDADMKKWQQTLENYEKHEIGVFKDWQGSKAVDRIITWDGKGEDGSLVESANDYMLFVRAEDTAGNIITVSHEIPIDVLVEKLPDGRLRIIINSINFKTGSDRMLGNYKSTLSRLIRILHKFPNYKIDIIGHTDSRGNDNYNLELSKKRAKSVYSYLVKNDINKDRLTVDGRGEAELMIKAEVVKGDEFQTDENYRKNRRVEFYLIKEETDGK